MTQIVNRLSLTILLSLTGAVSAASELTLYQLESRYHNQSSEGLITALADYPDADKVLKISALVSSNALNQTTGIELTRQLASCNDCSLDAEALNRILIDTGANSTDKILAASGLLAIKDSHSRAMLAKYYHTFEHRQDAIIHYLDDNRHQIQLN